MGGWIDRSETAGADADHRKTRVEFREVQRNPANGGAVTTIRPGHPESMLPPTGQGDRLSPTRPGGGQKGAKCPALSPDDLSPESSSPRAAPDRHFAVDNSSVCFVGKIPRPSTPCPQAVNRRPGKHSHGGCSGRLLHTGSGSTVKWSRGNAARARRETGRPGGRDAPGAQDRRETFENRTGSGSARTTAQARETGGSTTSRPQVSQEAWVKGRCGRATGSTVPLLYGESLSSRSPPLRHRRTCSDDPCVVGRTSRARRLRRLPARSRVHGSSEQVRR